jgi:hypothetical protein
LRYKDRLIAVIAIPSKNGPVTLLHCAQPPQNRTFYSR